MNSKTILEYLKNIKLNSRISVSTNSFTCIGNIKEYNDSFIKLEDGSKMSNYYENHISFFNNSIISINDVIEINDIQGQDYQVL